MKFHLSNTQRKELERGTGLFIALPIPRHEMIGDPLTWARDCLAVAPEWVRSVLPDEVDVDPSVFVGAGVFPAIVGDVAAEHLTLRVRILKATLAASDRRLRTNAKVQWPGGAIERAEVV